MNKIPFYKAFVVIALIVAVVACFLPVAQQGGQGGWEEVGSDPGVGPLARERIAIMASKDCWWRYGADAIFYSDDLTTQTLHFDGATGNVETAGGYIFEGATADDYETTIAVVDPTADRTATLPNVSGTIHVNEATQNLIANNGTFSGDVNVTGYISATSNITSASVIYGVGLDAGDADIDNVADIAVDTISADGGSSFTMSNDWTNAGNTVADLGIVTTADTNGGTIDGTIIGGASAAAGTVTTLVVTSTADFQDDIADSVGDLTIADDAVITGALNLQGAGTFDSTLDVVTYIQTTGYVSVEDASYFQGDLSDLLGDFTIADNAVITGTLDAQGDIANSTGDIVIADDVDITLGLDVRGGDITLQQDATIANSQANVITFTVTTAVFSEDVTVTGDLIVAGTTGVDISGGDLILENDEVWSNSTDDVMATDGMLGFLQWISDTTASLTLTPAESGKLIINDGVSGMIYVTLPDSAAGLFYGALAEDDHDMRVEPAAGEQILGCTNAAGDACVLDTQYDAVWLVGTADAWLVVYQVGTLADGD